MSITDSCHRRAFLQQASALGFAVRGLTCFDVRADQAAVPDVGQTEQLFLDLERVEATKGLKTQLHQPKKMGLIQEADGKPWEIGDASWVVRDRAGRFHMGYRLIYWDPSVRDLHAGIRNDPAHYFRDLPAYATSADGIRWTKPLLGLIDGPIGFRKAPQEKWKDGVFFEPTGFSRQNNYGCPLANVQDLNQFGGVNDPQRRFLINVIRKNDTHNFADIVDAGLYYAADFPDLAGDPVWRKKLQAIWEGKHRGARGPVTRVAGFDEKGQVWVECAQCTFGNIVRLNGRCISRWTSRNLRNWSPEEIVLPIAADESRQPTDWVEYMELRAERLGDLWLGQMVIYHGDRSTPQSQMPTQPKVFRKGTTEVRLVVSRDAGRTWRRVGDKQAWLPHHQAEDGYDRMVFVSSSVRVGDELWLYYSAWDGDHLSWNRDNTPYYKDRVRIGRTARAVLRWNGYVSLRSENETGEVVTKPFRTNGRQLVVNAMASKGTVQVEVQDAEGKSLPGFTSKDCDALRGDGVAQIVSWRGERDLPMQLRERPLRLRFDVKQADLYGFRCLG